MLQENWKNSFEERCQYGCGQCIKARLGDKHAREESRARDLSCTSNKFFEVLQDEAVGRLFLR